MKTLILSLVAAASFAAAAPASATVRWQNGYYTQDGYTSGHWKTNPNGTCLDNLGGC